MADLIVYKNRTNIIQVFLGFDVSNDILTSEIREEKHHTSPLIATWELEYVTDGTDGELTLTLDDSITSTITLDKGYTDIKRITGGEPINVFDNIIKVQFKDVVTA